MNAASSPKVRPRQPVWIRVGDAVALLVVAAIFAIGFFSYGLVEDGFQRSAALAGCALLGCWALIGWAARRFDGADFRPGKWWMAVLAVACVAAMAQLIPLPVSTAAQLSPLKGAAIMADPSKESGGVGSVAIAPEKALRSVQQLAASLMFFAAVLMLAARRRASQWLVVIICTVIMVEGLLGLIRFVALGAARGFGAIYNPNHHATAVAMGLPLYYAALIIWRRQSRTFSAPLLGGKNPLLTLFALGGIAAIGWLASMSRASIAIGSILIFCWAGYEAFISRQLRQSITKAKLATAGIVLVIAVVVGLVSLPDFSQRFSRTDTLSGNSRLLLWDASLQGLMETHGLGLGLGGAEYAINQHAGYPLVTVPIWSHNDYVEWLCELGIPAFAVLFILGAFAMRKTIAANRERRRLHGRSVGLIQRAALCGAVIGLVHAGLDFHLRVPLIGFELLTLVALFLQQGTLLQSRNGRTGEQAK